MAGNGEKVFAGMPDVVQSISKSLIAMRSCQVAVPCSLLADLPPKVVAERRIIKVVSEQSAVSQVCSNDIQLCFVAADMAREHGLEILS